MEIVKNSVMVMNDRIFCIIGNYILICPVGIYKL